MTPPQSSYQPDSDSYGKSGSGSRFEETPSHDHSALEMHAAVNRSPGELPQDGEVVGPGGRWVCRKETPDSEGSTYVFEPRGGRPVSGFSSLDACVDHAEGRA